VLKTGCVFLSDICFTISYTFIIQAARERRAARIAEKRQGITAVEHEAAQE
jgi:hypothetical protein